MIEPGEKFTVTYGERGRKFESVGLNWRQERAAAIERNREVEDTVDAQYQKCESILQAYTPHLDNAAFEALLETLNLALLQDLASKLIDAHNVSEDDEKKLEPPHSSDRANCVAVAPPTAREAIVGL